jgi:taurine dioxygenase
MNEAVIQSGVVQDGEIQSGEIGCIKHDLNFSSLSSEQISEIKQSVYHKKIVVIKNQKLNEQQFCDFSQLFGEPVPYLQENYHHPDYPLIFVSSNIKQNGKKIGVARTGGYWHSDTSFLADPVPLTLLYPQVIPNNSKRTTLFIDLEKALAEMPKALKEKIEGKRFIHSGKWKYKVRSADVGLDLSEILIMIHRVQPPVTHPAILTHPVTGKKTLYASRGFTVGVSGMPTDEANELLDELFDFIEQDRFITEFQWQPGDVIIWDNRFLAHKAGRLMSANEPISGDSIEEEETLVYRIIVKDGYPLGGSTLDSESMFYES